MILSNEQAAAVYSAMCALNNVGGRLHTRIKDRYEGSVIHFVELPSGHLQLYWGDAVGNPHGDVEHHHNQSAFATAYGLQQG